VELSSESARQTETGLLENGLRVLWEKVKRAGELIGSLREENGALRARCDQLEMELRKLQTELQKREQQTARVAHEAGTVISNGEKEALAARVKELLGKIEAYL
jgi:hypothetical protein